MPRIRTIKPEFWQDEELADCSPEARLLAIGILNYSDDEGYFKASPRQIKAQIFPFTDGSLNVHGLLTELSNMGYIRCFEGGDGKAYGQVVNFLKHQTINRPKESKIKDLDAVTDLSVTDHGAITDESRGKERKERNIPPDESGAEYAFEGDTIKISKKDYDRLSRQYPNLDLTYQLAQLDLELRGKKNWFVELNSKLNYRNKTPAHHAGGQGVGSYL